MGSPSPPVPPASAPPTAELRFRWPWRPYQERVLSAFDQHRTDGRLHVVAAPGAGKTSLGLEVFRRLGRPALVLTPTRTIRDQWVQRLADFRAGADGGAPPAWAGTDLDAPGFLTVVTYQALHARARRARASGAARDEIDETEDDPTPARSPSARELAGVLERLNAAGVRVLVLDEAHHLTREWWRALARLVEGLGEPFLVSLTATPPYEVTGREWARYQELCGPIDEEISVPELVRAGTLCPHQDLVLAVLPTRAESDALRDRQAAVERTCAELAQDAVLLRAVRGHPWLAREAPDPADVLERPELAVALLARLRDAGERPPRALLDLLDCRPRELPALDAAWWQVLVASYLEARGWTRDDEVRAHVLALRRRLRERGLLQRAEVRLVEPGAGGALATSAAKIGACVAVFARERALRGDALRQVVLTDWVRDDDAASEVEGRPRLGAWPVFRALVRAAEERDRPRLALLTGRLAAVHEGRRARLDALLDGELEAAPLAALPGFLRVRAPSSGRLVRAMTQLVTEGELHGLTGTRALLGEGWDAPAVNSLVLASTVGSFVTTNQMRGRAIRVDRARPDKVASLWHLVAVDPATPAGYGDLRELEQRFATFVGLAHGGASIESGLERLALPPIASEADVPLLEAESFARLQGLERLAEDWHRAVDGAVEGRVLPTLRATPPRGFRFFHFRRTLRFVLYEAVCAFVFWSAQGLELARGAGDGRLASKLLAGAAVLGALAALPGLAKWLWLLARHLPVDGSVRQIGLALRDALHAADLLETERRRLRVVTTPQPDGTVRVALAGGTFHEQSVFTDSLAELLGPIESPRYLITRRGGGLWRRRRDVHAVPKLLAGRKELAHTLLHAWRRRLGPATLVYTRTGDGRRVLLRARLRAFSSAFVPRAERLDRWH